MKIHVVVTHFSEPWDLVWHLYEWCEQRLRDHDIEFIVYHRGGDKYAWKEDVPPRVQIEPLQNVGRESYVVHHHICKNYSHMPDRCIFIPANLRTRASSVDQVLTNISGREFLPHPIHVPWSSEQFFQLNQWHGLSLVNREEVVKQEFTIASIRPFGRWYEARIPVPYKNKVVLNGVISIPKANILKYPLSLYEGWLKELHEGGVNPEIGHYWERTWYSLFS